MRATLDLQLPYIIVLLLLITVVLNLLLT